MQRIKYMRFLFSVLSISILASCTSKNAAPEQQGDDKSVIKITKQQSKSLGIDTVKEVYGQKELTLTGKVTVDQDKVTSVFPIASGNVVKVNVSLGDKVHKGEVLALLRSSEVNTTQSQYEMALSDLKLAKKNLDNSEELYKSNYYSQNQVLSAQNDYKKAQSNVNMLKQQLKIYGANPEENDAVYKILAPIDGYIVDKNISENMQVRADNGTDLFMVSYMNTVWVVADVYESDLSRVHTDDPVEITTIAYPDKVFDGKIQKINTLLDPTSKTLKVRIVLDNSEGLLKPDMFASIKVHSQKQQQYISIPTKALVFENNKYEVVVAKSDTTFEKRIVKILRSDGDITYLISGVSPGERIVTDGSLIVAFDEE